MKKILVSCFGLLLFATACNAPDDPDDILVKCDFDQEGMLTNYADEIIIPRFGEFEVSLLYLEGAYDVFAATPTIGLLNEMRIMYGAAYGSYQKCSPFGFGPALIDGTTFTQQVNIFPTNTTTINSNIENEVPVSSSSVAAVGFPAIDYLLFGEQGTTDAQIVELFTTDVNAQKRMAYLGQLIAELKNTVVQINDDWEGYRSTFVGNTGNAAGSSLSLLVNAFNYDFETLKNYKFKIPLGKFNGGIVLPASVEAYYAGGSVQLAKEQVTALKESYLGTREDGSDGLGLYDYVLCVKPLTEEEQGQGLVALADDISQHFLDIETALDDVPDPLSETLVSNKPVVDNAHSKMQTTVPLIKQEMTSALGVQISYQDNDGD